MIQQSHLLFDTKNKFYHIAMIKTKFSFVWNMILNKKNIFIIVFRYSAQNKRDKYLHVSFYLSYMREAAMVAPVFLYNNNFKGAFFINICIILNLSFLALTILMPFLTILFSIFSCIIFCLLSIRACKTGWSSMEIP